MLAMSVRVRPCSARTLFSSLGRVTWIDPSSALDTWIGSATVCESVPFGPSTWTCRPSIVTSTPAGTGMGSRPIRDMLCFLPSLPDVGEDFPANSTLPGLLVRHEAAGRRQDRDAQAAQHTGQVVLLGIDPQTGLRDPAQARECTLTVRPELQLYHEVLADLGVLHAPGLDVALLLEDLGDVRLDLGVRHRHGVVIGRVRVTQTCQ